MAKFSIGEIAVVCGAYFHPEHIGLECEVCSKLEMDEIVGEFHWCLYNNLPSPSGKNGAWKVSLKHLRKKQPPQELSTWEQVQKDTNWNPVKIKERNDLLPR